MSDSDILKISDLWKVYPSRQKTTRTVLQGLTFTMETKEWLAITGPSGSGKTTLLSIIAGFSLPTKGTIVFKNHTITAMPRNARLQLSAKNIGIVTQHAALEPYFSVLENLFYSLAVRRQLSADSKAYCLELLVRLGLQEVINKLPGELSAGELQRVSIARALAHKPSLLLADEPTGDLDLANSLKVAELFKAINAQSTSILMVTHAQSLAKWAHHSLQLINGKLLG